MRFDLIVAGLVMFMLLAIGLELSPADFAGIRKRGVLLAAGLLAPLLVLPVVALLLVAAFEPPPAIAAGVLLIAACPIGGISNTYSYLAGASVALSVALTTLSSLVAVVAVPLVDRFFTAVRGRSLGLDAPVGVILGQLLMLLALPVATGMLLRRLWPAGAARWHGPLRRAVFVAIGVLLLLVVLRDAAEFVRHLRSAVPMAAVFVVTAFAVGWLTARALGGAPADCFTFGSEFSTRNVAVATAIAMSVAGRPDYAIFATAYFMTELPMLVAAAAIFRRLLSSQSSVVLGSGTGIHG